MLECAQTTGKSNRAFVPPRSWQHHSVPSNVLARTELGRAVRRVAPQHAGSVRDVLSRVVTLRITTDVCERAARLGPATMRGLDAIHLANALLLGDELEGVLPYDERLAAAAESAGLPVLAPTDT